MKRQILLVLGFLLVMILISGCFAGPNTMANTLSPDETIAGFWMGLWHGVIAPLSFILSLFTDNVHLYEIHNNGAWYDFGFVLGAGILFGGGGSRSKCRKRR
jgi:hypothetical protein